MPTIETIPHDDEDAWRLAQVRAGLLRDRLRALSGALEALLSGSVKPLPSERPHTHRARVRDLLARDLALLTARECAEVERMLWQYRRRLPAGMAPRMNPDDPVVRELRAKELVQGHA